MKFFVVLASLVLAINATSDKELWLEFKQNYKKEFRNLRDEQRRFAIFQDNLRTIEAHNELYDKGEKTWYMGVTKFTDMTDQEFKSTLNYGAQFKPVFQEPIIWHVPTRSQAPESVNWTSKGVVTEVKNQGQCGSCWAFSVTGAVEGAYALKTKKLVSLSEQNLMDCFTEKDGCKGAQRTDVFKYIKNNGIDSESDYPYEAANGKCRFIESKSVTRVSGYVILPKTEDALLDAVANIGPISVTFDARRIQHYSGGIFNDPACDPPKPNHAVLVVGYGKENGLEYWLVKNSWGKNWGDDGYFKIAKNKNNHCAIASYSIYPII